MQTTILRLKGLGATAANAHIEKAIEAVRGVESVEMNVGDGEILIEHDGADTEKIREAVRALGYDEAEISG
ncbi:MAG: heavy-metal-associated domain-containing protein [Nibricoccus sp.]